MITTRESQVGRRTVVQILIRHAAYYGKAVGDRSDPRHVLTEMHPGNGGGDGTKRAAYIQRRGRFRVPHIDLALPPMSKNHNHRFGFAEADRLLVRRRDAWPKQG